MKVVRVILTILACFIIAVGAFSVVGYELYFKHIEPVLPAQQAMQEETAPVEDNTEADAVQSDTAPDVTPEADEPDEELLRAKALVETMTLEQKVYQMFFVTPEALTGVEAAVRAGDATKEALLAHPVGGLLYSDKNLEDAAQIKALLSGTQAFLTQSDNIPAFLAIDEEGGDVSPVADALDTTAFDTMAKIGATDDPQAAYSMGETIAKEIRAFGFDVNFAPIADLSGNALIDTRSFSDDPALAAAMVSSVIRGTQENGVLNAIAHFPGLGSIDDVAHIENTRIEKTLEDMRTEDLQPFISAIEKEAGFIVVSHAILSSVDDQRPCSMSTAVLSLLREDLGYTGIILTDPMDIPAITDHYASDEAALNALMAGADMIQCPDKLDEAVEAVLDAVKSGKLEESRIDESVQRILAAKIKLGLIS